MAINLNISQDAMNKAVEIAAKEATDFLIKLAPKESANLDDILVIEKIFDKYRRLIPPVLKDLKKVEQEIELLFTDIQERSAVSIIKNAQLTMLKGYGIIFSLGEVITKEKATYDFVFSEGSLGAPDRVRVATLSLKDLFKYTSLRIGEMDEKGKRNIGISLANLRQLQLLRNSLNKREQTEQEKQFGITMYGLKTKKNRYARTAEAASAQMRGAIITKETELSRDNAAARTMSDVRQYFSPGEKGPRVEVKHFGKYKDWKNGGQVLEGTASLIGIASLKNDLQAIRNILLKRHKVDVEGRVKALEHYLYERASFLQASIVKKLEKSIKIPN